MSVTDVPGRTSGTKARPRKLPVNRLRDRVRELAAEGQPPEAALQRFVERHEFPIVEGLRCTFAVRVDADEQSVDDRDGAVFHELRELRQNAPVESVARKGEGEDFDLSEWHGRLQGVDCHPLSGVGGARRQTRNGRERGPPIRAP